MGWEFWLFCLGGVAVLAGCVVPNRFLPGSLPNDKFLHFASFAVLAALALRIAQGRTEAALWLAGLLLAGWAIECAQALVPDRKFCWRDVGANAAGIAFAVACAGLTGFLEQQ
jgi:VanZ family protein